MDGQGLVWKKITRQGHCIVEGSERPAIQDELSHLSCKQIREQWEGLDKQGRRNFLWLWFTAMDQESALHMLALTTIEDLRREMEAAQADGWDSLNKAAAELNRRKEALEKHVEIERVTRARHLEQLRETQAGLRALEGENAALEADRVALKGLLLDAEQRAQAAEEKNEAWTAMLRQITVRVKDIWEEE